MPKKLHSGETAKKTKNGYRGLSVSFNEQQVVMLQKAASNGYDRTMIVRMAMQQLAKAQPDLFK